MKDLIILMCVVLFIVPLHAQESFPFDKDPHYIDGGIGAQDNYPLMEPIDPAIEFIEELIEDIQDMYLSKGLENSLSQKLNNALKSINKGKTNTAINQINAFINGV